MGNLIPAVFWLIPTCLAIRAFLLTHQLIGPGLWLLILGDILGWLVMDQVGLYENARMKRRLLAILGKAGKLSDDRIFVGFTSPKYTGVLDAHEDVGFLCFREGEIEFVSETRTLAMQRHEIESVSFRLNVHSLVLLGRWICVQGTRNQSSIRMLIEPRERRTMSGNLFYGKTLRKKIESWLHGSTRGEGVRLGVKDVDSESTPFK
jgi:hypothetical protein